MTTILFAAAYSDEKTGKIPNKIIVAGYIIGFVYNLYQDGLIGIAEFIVKALWPILFFYILFLINSFGAGDIKILSAISPLLDIRIMILGIFVSLLVGAGISMFALICDFNRGRKIRFGKCLFLGFTIAIVGENVGGILRYFNM